MYFFVLSGTNCNSLFLNHYNKPDLDFLKHIAKEVLTALDYLHRNNVVHRDVDGKFVLLSNTGKNRVILWKINSTSGK